MSSKKYKTLQSSHILSNLSDISKKSLFIGVFQLKSLDYESLIFIKQQTFPLNLKTFVCKNTFVKKNKLFSSLSLSSVSEGPIFIFYSFLSLPNYEKIIDIVNKTKLLPLFFSIENKLIFFKNLPLLLNKSKTEFLVSLVKLLDYHNKRLNSILMNSNSYLQYLLYF